MLAPPGVKSGPLPFMKWLPTWVALVILIASLAVIGYAQITQESSKWIMLVVIPLVLCLNEVAHRPPRKIENEGT